MKKLMMVAVLAWGVCCLAADITALDGTVYRSVKVLRVEPDGLNIQHSGGVTKVDFLNLPESVRKQYNYDATKAEGARKAAASGKSGDWREMDQRTVFLMTQLSSVEASLGSIAMTLSGLSGQRTAREYEADRARQANEEMDRKGGGPEHWSTFYPRYAEKFFYHPTDRNSTYHTLTVLGQRSVPEGGTAYQGVPVAARPPQFDYIYRANTEAAKRAQTEIARLGGDVAALVRRRRELEAEQAALWCKIGFHAVASQDLLAQPLYRSDLKAEGPSTAETGPRLEAMRAAMEFLRDANRLAAMVEQGVDGDASRSYEQLRAGLAAARDELQRRLLAQPATAADAVDPQTPLGQMAAVARRMTEISANIVDAQRLALDGDLTGDQRRKQTFRYQLQQSLLLCAEALLAGDECAGELARRWKVQSAAQIAVAAVSPAIQPYLAAPTSMPRKVTADEPALLAAAPLLTAPPAGAPAEVKDLFTPEFAALSPDERLKRVLDKLHAMNPQMAMEEVKYSKDALEVTAIELPAKGLKTIWPLRALTSLRAVRFGSHPRPGGAILSEVADLSPLRGLPLMVLNCSFSQVADLSPLTGMPLRELYCGRTHVSDLSPLRGMKLVMLDCGGTQVSDLSPIRGMPLQVLRCGSGCLADLSPLRGMALTELACGQSKVTDLSPLAGMPLHTLNLDGSAITDLRPLAGLPLEKLRCSNVRLTDISSLARLPVTHLWLKRTRIADLSPLRDMRQLRVLTGDFSPQRDGEILRSITSLEVINNTPVAEFWRNADAGKGDAPVGGEGEDE